MAGWKGRKGVTGWKVRKDVAEPGTKGRWLGWMGWGGWAFLDAGRAGCCAFRCWTTGRTFLGIGWRVGGVLGAEDGVVLPFWLGADTCAIYDPGFSPLSLHRSLILYLDDSIYV